MSLINEALKRTRDNLPTPPPAGALPYQTPPRAAAPAPPTRHSRTPLTVALSLLAVLLVAGVVWGIHVGRRAVNRLPQQTAEVAGAPLGPAKPAEPLPAPVETPVSEPVPATAEQPAPVASAPPPPAEAAVPSASPPEPPRLVLQGITLDSRLREALINGQVVRVGDTLAGVTVVAIEPRCVTVRWQDTELMLRMP